MDLVDGLHALLTDHVEEVWQLAMLLLQPAVSVFCSLILIL